MGTPGLPQGGERRRCPPLVPFLSSTLRSPGPLGILPPVPWVPALQALGASPYWFQCLLSGLEAALGSFLDRLPWPCPPLAPPRERTITTARLVLVMSPNTAECGPGVSRGRRGSGDVTFLSDQMPRRGPCWDGESLCVLPYNLPGPQTHSPPTYRTVCFFVLFASV